MEEDNNLTQFYIPKNVSTRFELMKGIGIKEIIYTGIATIVGVILAIILYQITQNYFISAGIVATFSGGTFIVNMKDNNNQSILDIIKNVIRFSTMQKFYKYVVKEEGYGLTVIQEEKK